METREQRAPKRGAVWFEHGVFVSRWRHHEAGRERWRRLGENRSQIANRRPPRISGNECPSVPRGTGGFLPQIERETQTHARTHTEREEWWKRDERRDINANQKTKILISKFDIYSFPPFPQNRWSLRTAGPGPVINPSLVALYCIASLTLTFSRNYGNRS